MAKRKRGRPRKRDTSVMDYITPETQRTVFIILLFLISILGLFSLFGLAGTLGEFVNIGFTLFFGWGKWVIPFSLLTLAYFLIRQQKYPLTFINYLGFILGVLSLQGALHGWLDPDFMIEAVEAGTGGGYLGLLVAYPIVAFLDNIVSMIVLIAIFILGTVMFFNGFLEDVLENFSFLYYLNPLNWFRRRDDEEDEEIGDMEEEEEEEDEEEEEEEDDEELEEAQEVKMGKSLIDMNKVGTVMANSPKRKTYKKIDLPIDLLDLKSTKALSGNIKQNQAIIQKTLENFNIPVTMSDVQVGPTVTQFTLKPEEGIRLSRIVALADDLSLALAAHPLRIEAPIPGKPLVGIEVPNKSVATVTLREIISSKEFKEHKSPLTISLGKDVSGAVWTEEISKMPHLLVAGATGSGKSVCLNTIVVSLLYQNSPDDLKFLMIDPKRVGLTLYDGIPYLLDAVVTDVKKTVNALKWCIGEMDRRYQLLQSKKKSNIADFNASGKEKLPYIVVMIDELADLMVTASRDVEPLIIRLAQMARAVGIHLVLATQRPSVDVITGLIKSNITSRIAFSVASGMDSRTILDTTGAEKLIGRGDMLYSSATLSKPVRIQGAYVSDNEIKRVVDHIKEAYGEPEYNEEVTQKQSKATSFDYGGDEDDDEMYEEAKEAVIAAGKASTSFLQRRLRIGFSRAGRLIDMLEERGIIGPPQGSKPREVLVTEEEDFEDEEYEEDYQEEAEEDDDEPTVRLER